MKHVKALVCGGVAVNLVVYLPPYLYHYSVKLLGPRGNFVLAVMAFGLWYGVGRLILAAGAAKPAQ